MGVKGVMRQKVVLNYLLASVFGVKKFAKVSLDFWAGFFESCEPPFSCEPKCALTNQPEN